MTDQQAQTHVRTISRHCSCSRGGNPQYCECRDLEELAAEHNCKLELRPQADPPMGSPWEVWEYETGYVAGGEDPAGAVEGARRWLERCGRAPAKVRSWLDAREVKYERSRDGSIWIDDDDGELLLCHTATFGWRWYGDDDANGELPAEGWEDALAELLAEVAS